MPKDLSLYHQPLTNLFPALRSDQSVQPERQHQQPRTTPVSEKIQQLQSSFSQGGSQLVSFKL